MDRKNKSSSIPVSALRAKLREMEDGYARLPMRGGIGWFDAIEELLKWLKEQEATSGSATDAA